MVIEPLLELLNRAQIRARDPAFWRMACRVPAGQCVFPFGAVDFRGIVISHSACIAVMMVDVGARPGSEFHRRDPVDRSPVYRYCIQ